MTPLRVVSEHHAHGVYGRCFGKGPRRFVGFHGWSGSHESFAPLLPTLPENASFLCLDLPGAGRSQDPTTWSVQDTVAPLERALETMCPNPVELVAACGGASFALPLAAKRPDLVQRLVLIDPFAFVPWYFRIFTWPGFGALFYATAFANPLGRIALDRALATRRTEETSLTEGFEVVVDHRRNRGQLRAMCDAASTPLGDFGAFRGSVTLVHGAHTFAAVVASVRRFEGAFPNARVHLAYGAGHMPMHEASAQVADIVYRSEGEGMDAATHDAVGR